MLPEDESLDHDMLVQIGIAVASFIAVSGVVYGAVAIARRRKLQIKVTAAVLKASVAEKDKYSAEAKTQQVEREKAALQDKLYAAKKLVNQVMSEGGKLLDTYHLDYSDIDFGGDDEEERCKLGEGAQVMRMLCACATNKVMPAMNYSVPNRSRFGTVFAHPGPLQKQLTITVSPRHAQVRHRV